MSHMIIFLALYLCIYGTAHLYFLVKARRAYYLHGAGYFLVSAALLFLLLAPIQGRLLEMQGHFWPAVIVTWLGFIWMGFLFLFTCISLPLDAYHIFIGMGQKITGDDLTGFMLSRRQSIAIAIVAACGLLLYGVFEARQVKTRAIALHSQKLPPAAGRIRIVQISDLHMGLMSYPGSLSPAIRAINQAKPDILVSTGDLIDGHLFNENHAAAKLREIPTPLGKYAVTGNHEFYIKANTAQAFTKAAGFTLLQDASVSVKGLLTIVGVDDPANSNRSRNDAEIEAGLLGKISGDPFILLLKHRPAVAAGSSGRFDLQLSGHTHQGQIFPFGFPVSLLYPMGHGLHELAEGGHIYISRGTGTWGPPVRLLAPPEITVIDIIPRPPPPPKPEK